PRASSTPTRARTSCSCATRTRSRARHARASARAQRISCSAVVAAHAAAMAAAHELQRDLVERLLLRRRQLRIEALGRVAAAVLLRAALGAHLLEAVDALRGGELGELAARAGPAHRGLHRVRPCG